MILYLNCYKDPAQQTWTKADYLIEAAKRIGIDYIKPYNNEPNPDYVLNIEPFTHFVQGKKWTSVYEVDVMFDRPQMSLSDWIASNTVFVANTFIPSRMNTYQGNLIFLPQACDPVLHKRNVKIVPKYDFVFSGSLGLQVYEERERTMNLLKDAGFSFMGFPKERPPYQYVDFLSQGKVQFVRSARNTIGSSQVEQRFFECLSVGPVLKDYHPALEAFGLEEGKDFYWYKDDKEMLEKMAYLINNPDFAKTMAENGRQKALLNHTYDHRLISILNVIYEYS